MTIYGNAMPDFSKCSLEDLVSISQFHRIILNYLRMMEVQNKHEKNGVKIKHSKR